MDGTETPAGTAQAADVAKTAAPAETQAADPGPVQAGGTTGMGEPRTTGPDAALPADGPQAQLPGDVPGRQVIKAAALKVLVYDRAGQACKVTPDAIRQSIAKADGGDDGKTPMQAVFDENGDLVGIVDPADITPVAGAGSKPAADSSDGGAQDAPAPAADPTPAPAGDVGTPADGVAKQEDGQDVITVKAGVLKSTMAEAVSEALASQGAAHQEVVAKLAADKDEQAEEIKTLKARLAVVEEQPAAPKVFTNGQTPPASMLRGQDQGAAASVNVAKARQMRADFRNAEPAEQNRIAGEMQQQAIDGLAAIHGRAS